jgi:hypothetical protein
MLTRNDVHEQLKALAARAGAIGDRLKGDGEEPAPIVLATVAVEVARLQCKLDKVADQVAANGKGKGKR